MMHKTIVLCLFFACPGSLQAQEKECPTQLSFGKDLWRYTGRYDNPAYGYSTQIPNGLVGIVEKNSEDSPNPCTPSPPAQAYWAGPNSIPDAHASASRPIF